MVYLLLLLRISREHRREDAVRKQGQEANEKFLVGFMSDAEKSSVSSSELAPWAQLKGVWVGHAIGVNSSMACCV